MRRSPYLQNFDRIMFQLCRTKDKTAKKKNMIRSALTFAIGIVTCIHAYGQETARRTLEDYIRTAKENSPLITDFRNRSEIQQAELQRLKAMYTHSRLEADGEWLFVPIIENGQGQATFRWNAQDAADYTGYDLGESSGHLHAGITWYQPILGISRYKTAREQANLDMEAAENSIRLEEHQIERTVTEQYLLCLLDKIQTTFSDTTAALLDREEKTVAGLVQNGMARQSDLMLIRIEQQKNAESRTASRQSYRTHIIELNLMCGIDDTGDTMLENIDLQTLTGPSYGRSLFTEQFRLDSLKAAADLRTFKMQYRPSLDLFVSGGLQTGSFAGWYRHFGMSAGLSLSWTIFDGRQKRWKEKQLQLQLNTIRTYEDNAEYRRRMRLDQCLSELAACDERSAAMEEQLSGYGDLLENYGKEMAAGQVSVLDYITVLKNKIQTERDYMLLQTNRQLTIAAYNYWNR